MYGLLLEAICFIIKKDYGEEKWVEISRRAGIELTCFSTHEVYNENLIPNIAETAAKVLGKEADQIMYQFGEAFVSYVGQYGYDNVLKVLGRNMRDFLNGLDNLHEYLRFSYPKMSAPSFFVEDENENGLILHYRTRRKGFIHYVMGQIRQVGRTFYDTDVHIVEVSQEKTADDTTQVTFRLTFNNAAYRENTCIIADSVVDNIPLRAELLFELFPFHVVFDHSLTIRAVGAALRALIPDAVGQKLSRIFFQVRPLTSLTWDEVLRHTNNVYELVSEKDMKKNNTADPDEEATETEDILYFEEKRNRLHLKGQMLHVKEWESIMFLGTPVMQNLDDMFNVGLFINDLSMHDCSRDLVLAGTQQSAELRLALEQEQQKSRLLGESMKKLDTEMQRTDTLLYQMIPKPVADRLRRGEPSVATCQAFECVTILFSDVVGFTTICSRITPMEVVSMLNGMYTVFDKLSELHDVYKVETIGDAYMAVAGAPTVTDCHALSMCDMALDMLQAMSSLKDPSTQDSMRIRVGIHTGSTVAGVVGIKMPRYCLFGDTVNTASRMETNGEAMKIHISETTRQMLIEDYQVEERGEVEVKGKGAMKTYWLWGRKGMSVRDKKLHEQKVERMAEEAKQVKAAEERDSRCSAHSGMSAHRHVYSPVSFEDLTADPAHSSLGSPDHFTTHAVCREAISEERDTAGQVGDGPQQHRTSTEAAPSLNSGYAVKPTQAVPPTRSGSTPPPGADGAKARAMTEDGTARHAQGNGIHHPRPPPPPLSHHKARPSHCKRHRDTVSTNNNSQHAPHCITFSEGGRRVLDCGRDGGGRSVAGSAGTDSSASPGRRGGRGGSPGHSAPGSDRGQKGALLERSNSKTCVLL